MVLGLNRLSPMRVEAALGTVVLTVPSNLLEFADQDRMSPRGKKCHSSSPALPVFVVIISE
jgi:hypothetical protein